MSTLLKESLNKYNKVELANKIKTVIILGSSITPEQLNKETTITLMYNKIKSYSENYNIYLINPKKVKIVNSNGNISLVSNYKTTPVDIKDTVIFYRRAKNEDEIDFQLLNELESLGFICINSLKSIKSCNDKYETFNILTENDIPTPRTVKILKTDSQENMEKHISSFKSPFIIKVLDGSQGKGVVMAETEKSAKSIIQALLLTNDSVLIQEFLENDGDLRVHVVNNEIVASMKRSASNKNEFRANASLGGNVEKCEIDLEIQKIAKKANEVLGCVWSGVDIIVSNGKPYVIEVNASPGLIGISKTTQEDIVYAILDNLVQTHLSQTVGLINPLKIDGIDYEFKSMIDTGNMKRSISIHADSINIDGDYVEYKINGKTFKDKIVKTIKVKNNSDSKGISDIRPVIEKSVIFNNKKYNNILLDLNDRSHKKYDALINLDFIKLAKLKIDVFKE